MPRLPLLPTVFKLEASTTAADSLRASQTSDRGQTRRFDDAPITSDLPLLADLLRSIRHFSSVPMGDMAGF
jgi:hypothetical protein